MSRVTITLGVTVAVVSLARSLAGARLLGLFNSHSLQLLIKGELLLAVRKLHYQLLGFGRRTRNGQTCCRCGCCNKCKHEYKTSQMLSILVLKVILRGYQMYITIYPYTYKCLRLRKSEVDMKSSS